jgi:hypothetical protein
MEEVLIKVAPTVYDILEATIRAAIEFTEAEAGHIFLIKRLEDQVLVSHQCLLTDKGVIIRQYEEDRPFMYGPCQRSIEEGKMYYVHDAQSNPLHRLLLAELGRIMRKGHEDGLKRKYLQDYLEFLARARSYISVPIKGLHTEQAFLVAAGNISKLFWPSEEQKQRLPERGSELRASLAVGDNSPLKPRGFRDRFEHFDVCLETWAAKPHHHFFDANIGPEAMWFGGFKPNPETYLRNFDTTTFAITIQGETYHLRPIIDAIQALYPRAVARRQELSAGF